MFGSVFKLRPKPGKFEAIQALIARERKERGGIPGERGAYILQEANGDVWVMAIFESEATYRKNADDPEQDKWYRQMRELLEADPEWHDGNITEDRP